MAIYSKAVGVAINPQDLLEKLRDFLVAQGFVLELYSDNIISSVNLGKRLHLSKNGKYYNFAASLNNRTNGSLVSYINNSISEIGANISLSFNSSSSWFGNNGSNIVKAEIKENCGYWFYVNNKNIIIIIKYQANRYTMISLGEAENLGTELINYQAGTSIGINSGASSATRLENVPLFRKTQSGAFIDSTFISFNSSTYNLNHYNESGQGTIPNFYKGNGLNDGFIQRANNIFTGTSVLMPIKSYRLNNLNQEPLFTLKDLFIVNFANLNAEDTMTLGTRQYDVFPFFQKEIPQTYNNSESLGMGIAIKIAE